MCPIFHFHPLIFPPFHIFVLNSNYPISLSPIAKLAFPLPLSEVSNNCEIVSNYNQKFNFKLSKTIFASEGKL